MCIRDRLVTAGPTASYSLTAPTNSGSYDVGTTITFNFSATSFVNVSSMSAPLDSASTITNGQVIDVNSLNAGAHTFVITATDGLGTTSTTTITFQVHATAAGVINAVNQGAQRGLITPATQSNLVSMLNTIQSYVNAGKLNQAKSQLQSFITYVQGQSGYSIDASYAARLVNWAQDLYNRL